MGLFIFRSHYIINLLKINRVIHKALPEGVHPSYIHTYNYKHNTKQTKQNTTIKLIS